MVSSKQKEVTAFWQKYRVALQRLDNALDKLDSIPKGPVQATLKPAFTQDTTEFSVTSQPTDIRDMKPADVHELFIEGTLPLEYRDMIKLVDKGTYIQSTAVTLKGQSDIKLHSPGSLEQQYPGILKTISLDVDNKVPISANASFGSKYPVNPNKGDVFLRVDQLPSKLFKFNGIKWIELDKDVSSSYAYNDEYIKYLTTMIDNGQYDTELLSESERAAIDDYLKD